MVYTWVEALSDIGKRLNSKIDKTSYNVRKFKPKLCCMMIDSSMNSEYEQYYSDETRQKWLNSVKDYKFDGYIATVEIQPSKEQRDKFLAGTISESDLVYRCFASIDRMITYVKEEKEIGLNMLGLEVHCLWARDNWSKLTAANFFPQFNSALTELMNNINCGGYIALFNECGTDTILNTSNVNYIKQSLQLVKNKGYKTGIAGVGVNLDLIDFCDVISIHSYPTITNKGENVTLDDGIVAWEASRLKEKWRNWHLKYPNKEIWLSETGTQNFYESLVWPEKYIATGTKSPNNFVQRVFHQGVLEYLKDETYINGVSLFYLDQSQHYDLLQELYDLYLRSEVNS